MRTLFVTCALLVLLTACPRERMPRDASPQQQPAAELALSRLRDLVSVDKENYKRVGFDSVAQVKEAGLGQPLDVYFVRRDKLREWKGQDPDALVLQSKSEETVYPVLVDQQMKSTVSIFRDASAAYRPATFGNAEIARTLAHYGRGQGDFIVRVPAFAMYFIGRSAANQVELTPVRADSRLPDYPPGKPVPSVQILQQLALLAKRPGADLPR
jgi:hypothetical protein